jgi:hypothetical protein
LSFELSTKSSISPVKPEFLSRYLKILSGDNLLSSVVADRGWVEIGDLFITLLESGVGSDLARFTTGTIFVGDISVAFTLLCSMGLFSL